DRVHHAQPARRPRLLRRQSAIARPLGKMATLAADIPVFRELTPGQRVLRRLVRRRGAMAGLAVVVFFVSVALLAPLVAPYDPLQTSWSAVRKAPSAMHFFGTDEIGRDVAARVIYGARAS